MHVPRARDVLLGYVREQASRRFHAASHRSDLDAVGRLLALAEWLDCLDWNGQASRLLDAAAPVGVHRTFPSRATCEAISCWADHGGQPLDCFIARPIDGELRQALDAELAAL